MRLPTSEVEVGELIDRACVADAHAVARLISLVEAESPLARTALARLTMLAGKAHVIGLTGAPGVGKSTSTAAIAASFRESGLRVGVLAVDPSSPRLMPQSAVWSGRVVGIDPVLDHDPGLEQGLLAADA